MSASNKLRSMALNALLSERGETLRRRFRDVRRRVLRRRHKVSVFLQLDDPYSYLLAYYLPALEQSFDIDLRLYLCEAQGGGYQPEAEMLAEYAVVDCRRLARELGIPFLDQGATPPVEHRRAMLDAIASLSDENDRAALLRASLAVFWRGDAEAAARITSGTKDPAGNGDVLVSENQQRLRRLGHYNSAMLHYEGEWYWGVDRLHYLIERLGALGAATESSPDPLLASIQPAMQVTLPVAPPAAAKALPALELFHSVRSPYSYLALRRMFEIADAFGLVLQIRPVLPMIMRGLQVPKPKLIYIVTDSGREARQRDIAFGRIADPVGKGVERSLAVWRYARSERRERDYLVNLGEAIWARGIDVSTDKGMRKVTGRTGLFWPDVVAAMQGEEWRDEVVANRDSMMASGLWGVPVIRLGDFVTWGQDRDWLLVRHIEELCDTGDGILV